MRNQPDFFNVLKQQARQIAQSRGGQVQAIPNQQQPMQPMQSIQAMGASPEIQVPQTQSIPFDPVSVTPGAPQTPVRPPRAGFTVGDTFIPGFSAGRSNPKTRGPLQGGPLNIWQRLPGDFRKNFMANFDRGYASRNEPGPNTMAGNPLTKKQAAAMRFAMQSLLDPERGAGLSAQGILDSIQGGVTLTKGNKQVQFTPLGASTPEDILTNNRRAQKLLSKGWKPVGRSDKNQEEVIRSLARIFADPKIAVKMERDALRATRAQDKLDGGSRVFADTKEGRALRKSAAKLAKGKVTKKKKKK